VKKSILLLVLLSLLCSLGATEKIGLALSGGGARGFAHIGILKVIDEVGLPIDAISGTSIGAIIGGLYAMGYSATEIESLCVKIDWKQLFNDSLERGDLSVSQKRWAPYGNYFFTLNKGLIPNLPSGFIPGQHVDELMYSLFYPASVITNFDDLPIPFRCVATNLITGEKKVFANGSLAEAVRASMSTPSVFHPYELDGQLYIDGGISQNLPADILPGMGVTRCIGLKVNSKLRNKNNLNDIIQVLDQTINIGITTKVNLAIPNCDLLIEPDLSTFNSSDYDNISEIIAAGEAAAREHIDQLKQLAELRRQDPIQKNTLPPIPERVRLQRINVRGNEYLSSSKVKEYLDLTPGDEYTKKQILNHSRDAYNFGLFDTIYPILSKSGDEYSLDVKVNEMARKSAAINLTYNQDDKLVAGVVFSFTNLLQKNSKLLAEVKVGGRQALNIDYAKNFGNNWGIYFRTFPNIEENKLYLYNENHEKTSSVRSLEFGSTAGIGFFARKILIVEGYGFAYNTRLYRDISNIDIDDKQFTSSGIGVKFYHESLDDYVFPMKGTQLLAKFSGADSHIGSDATYKKFRLNFQTGFPLVNRLSAFYHFEYGSYFKQMDVVQFDPFYFGGIDSFMGYQQSEKSAPFYKVNTFTIRTEPINNLFLEYKIAGLNYADSDIWTPFKNLTMGGGFVIGYRSPLGPMRVGLGITEDSTLNYFISVGYDYDIFEFSRR